MNLALVGGTCVGKTSVMNRLAEISGCTTRSCGNEVMRVAKSLGLPPDDLSEDDHRKIDRETQGFCSVGAAPFIVDGRYLQYVLSGHLENIHLIELVADNQIRSTRSAGRSRNANASSVNAIALSDNRDSEFCKNMYAGISPLKPDFVLDTSNCSIDQVANKILTHFSLGKK